MRPWRGRARLHACMDVTRKVTSPYHPCDPGGAEPGRMHVTRKVTSSAVPIGYTRGALQGAFPREGNRESGASVFPSRTPLDSSRRAVSAQYIVYRTGVYREVPPRTPRARQSRVALVAACLDTSVVTLTPPPRSDAVRLGFAAPGHAQVYLVATGTCSQHCTHVLGFGWLYTRRAARDPAERNKSE